MKVLLDLQNVIDSTELPSQANMQRWIIEALLQAKSQFNQPEVTIRIVSKDESQQLNNDYRAKNKATNVLSFPFEIPEMLSVEEIGEFLGDLVICEAVVKQEALEQKKLIESHWAHLIIHGIFHLLGYDHINDKDAEEMEALEITTLKQLGYINPY